jgi:hypothetical protein
MLLYVGLETLISFIALNVYNIEKFQIKVANTNELWIVCTVSLLILCEI